MEKHSTKIIIYIFYIKVLDLVFVETNVRLFALIVITETLSTLVIG